MNKGLCYGLTIHAHTSCISEWIFLISLDTLTKSSYHTHFWAGGSLRVQTFFFKLAYYLQPESTSQQIAILL